MKKAGVELFELIHSLGMAEKKYFKMFSSLQSGDKSYLKLYDAMEKQRSYNEDAIRKACRGQKFLQHLSVVNSRLYNNILRSLEIFHRSADINLRRQISKAEILLHKGLTAQALKLLKTAKLIAYYHERWSLLVEILNMERIPYATLDILKIPHLNEEKKIVMQKLKNIHDYESIHFKLTHRFQEAGSIRTKKALLLVAKLMRHTLVRDSKQAFCTEAKAYYYEIQVLYCLFKQDFIKGYNISKEQCDFIETHFHQLKDRDKKYLFALNLIVIFTGYILPADRSKYNEMQEVLRKLRAYPSLNATSWTYSYANELNALMRTGDFEKVFPALKAIEANEELLNQATADARINLYYNISYMLFGAGNYNEALYWLRKIIDQPTGILRQDTQAYTRILSLLIQYELHKEDAQMLDSLERSTMNFLSTRQRLFKVEEALLHCLRQIMGKIINKKERRDALQEFKTTLLKLMKNPFEKVVMEEFDFLGWVESKIQNKTFAEVVRSRDTKFCVPTP